MVQEAFRRFVERLVPPRVRLMLLIQSTFFHPRSVRAVVCALGRCKTKFRGNLSGYRRSKQWCERGKLSIHNWGYNRFVKRRSVFNKIVRNSLRDGVGFRGLVFTSQLYILDKLRIVFVTGNDITHSCRKYIDTDSKRHWIRMFFSKFQPLNNIPFGRRIRANALTTGSITLSSSAPSPITTSSYEESSLQPCRGERRRHIFRHVLPIELDPENETVG
jgi:hypothetical protein